MTTRADIDRPAAAVASTRLQSTIKAENHAASAAALMQQQANPAHLRQLAQEKQASAAHLLKQYEQRCNASPHTRYTEPVVALWEGHYALLERARQLIRKAEEAEARAQASSEAGSAGAIHTQTHRVTATLPTATGEGS